MGFWLLVFLTVLQQKTQGLFLKWVFARIWVKDLPIGTFPVTSKILSPDPCRFLTCSYRSFKEQFVRFNSFLNSEASLQEIVLSDVDSVHSGFGPYPREP